MIIADANTSQLATKRMSMCVQAQEISLNFHCRCEQFVHFASGGFFNFNGTAGAQSIRQHSSVP